MDDLELAIFQNPADVKRLQRVLIIRVHRFLAARGIELEAIDSLAYLVDIETSGLLNRGLPDIDAEIGSLDLVIGDSPVSIRKVVPDTVGLESPDEVLVYRRVDALKIVPAMA